MIARRFPALLLAAAALGLAGCGGAGPDRRPAASETEETPPPRAEAEEPAGEEPLEREVVTIWFPSSRGDGLAGERREIFSTASPADRAKQIVADLIAGPETEAALPALPPGTRLRQVYVLADGTAWADFSQEFLKAVGSGSSDEIRAVYAVVDSVALNVPEIARVGILVEGAPCEAAGGHLDLRRPLPPDRSLPEGAPEEPSGGGEEVPAGGGEGEAIPAGDAASLV